jgi:hypothetical protein
MSDELQRRKSHTEDETPDVEAHRHHSRRKNRGEDSDTPEVIERRKNHSEDETPDVEAHRHHSRRKNYGDDTESPDTPDVEAHRFGVSR